MSQEEKNEFRNDAKSLTDVLFDNGLFSSQFTRDEMNSVEDIIAHALKSRYDTQLRLKELMQRIHERKNSDHSA